MKSPPAIVPAAMLAWARKTAGYTIEEAARKISVSPQKLAKCEGGEDQITINQLKAAANVYKRPLALFFLAEPPPIEEPVADFRLAPELQQQPIPPSVKIALRQAKQKRDEALYLARDLDKNIPRLPVHAKVTDDAEELGSRISEFVGLKPGGDHSWNSSEAALKDRKRAVERLGVLVLEVSHVATEEMRGAALLEDELPVIILNGGDAPAGKSFTLFHELTHLLIRQSGVCDLSPPTDTSTRSNVERFCNAVAAACLMPRAEVLGQLGDAHTNSLGLDELRDLARPFRVSTEAYLIRLISLGRATYQQYIELKPRFREEYLKFKQAQRSKKSESGPSPAVMAVRNLGRPFVRLVLQAFENDRIGLATASDYLGVKVRHMDRVRELAAGRGGAE